MAMYLADVTKMSNDLWAPRIGVREAVRRVVRAFRENAQRPEDWMFE
jgi:hypothetical protein